MIRRNYCVGPAVDGGCPNHLWVHRPDRDQTAGRAAVLRSWCWLMNWRVPLRIQDYAAERRNQESSQ
jgi:hypothetical protein